MPRAGGSGGGRGIDLERALVAGAAIAYALPLLLSPYAPGGDTPWHAAVVAILAEPDGQHFLGAFHAEGGAGSYVAVYRLLALSARAIGAAAAVQVLCILYVAGLVLAARALARASGADGALALLAAPAAYSTTLEFGFLIYLPTLPLTLWVWALVREVMQGCRADGHPSSRRRPSRADGGPGPGRAIALAAAWLAICLCHPFAAAVAGAGAALLLLCDLAPDRRARAALVAAILVLGALPAGFALAGLSRGGPPVLPGLERASLADKITTQVFVPPHESVARAPAHLVGFLPEPWRFVLAALLAGLAIAWRIAGRGAARPAPVAVSTAGRRAPIYLALLLTALYLATPFTFEWPRNWYAAQPRLVPLLWVAVLVALGPAPGSRRMRAGALAASTAALLGLVFGALWPAAREARDLASVIHRARPAARTLGLIEQRAARDREPPEWVRNAPGWLVAERGGFVSHLPMAARGGLNSGQHIPVRLADGAAPSPAAPPLGFARAFRWERHAAGWDQFLIRDLDPARPHDYFAGHRRDVETVARAGRWRLVRRVE